MRSTRTGPCPHRRQGRHSQISVIAYDEGDYPISSPSTSPPNACAAHFATIVRGDVVRYELPGLGALNFVLHRRIGGRRHSFARRSMRTANV